MENDIFWSEIGSGLESRAANPHQESVIPPETHFYINRCCDHHICAVPNLFCSDKEYEVILKLFTVRTVCGISPLLQYTEYITSDALLGGVRKSMRIKF